VIIAAAKAFPNAVGASSGPLYATALLRAGKLAGMRQTMPVAECAALFGAMAERIAHRGKAEPGRRPWLTHALRRLREGRIGWQLRRQRRPGPMPQTPWLPPLAAPRGWASAALTTLIRGQSRQQ